MRDITEDIKHHTVYHSKKKNWPGVCDTLGILVQAICQVFITGQFKSQNAQSREVRRTKYVTNATKTQFALQIDEIKTLIGTNRIIRSDASPRNRLGHVLKRSPWCVSERSSAVFPANAGERHKRLCALRMK